MYIPGEPQIGQGFLQVICSTKLLPGSLLQLHFEKKNQLEASASQAFPASALYGYTPTRTGFRNRR